ncbi:hypothetical protein N7528_009890 [Penicillium herquei]|nr:hypothetical protein N7528_009890 [Penicillium herquei]
MSRRASTTKYYYEVDDVEPDRKKYPRQRRPGRGYEDDIEYGRRRISPPIEEMERMRLRGRPPREFVPENFPAPPPPRRAEQPVRMRRSSEEVMFAEDAFSHPRPRPVLPRVFDEKEVIVEEREAHGGRRRRPPREVEEEEIIIDRRERRGSYQRPRTEFDREEEAASRRRGRVPPFDHDREPEPRRRERSFSELRDELLAQSYGPGRKYRTREEASGIIDRAGPSSKYPEPSRSISLSREDEKIMQWKDRPTPKEEREDEDMFAGHRRRSDSRSRYDQGPPGAWPPDENVEPYFNKFYRERAKSIQREEDLLNEKEILIRREQSKRERRRLSIGSDELEVRREQRRPDPTREPPVLQDISMSYRQTDHGYDIARPPRAPSPENTPSHHSFDEIHVRHRSQRRGRRLAENIDLNHLDEEETTIGGQPVEFKTSWETDGQRRAPKPPSLDGESEPESFTRSRGAQYRDFEEDEMEVREKPSTPRSFAEELKLESTDEWSVVQTPSKEEAVEMTGALQIVEVAPKDASSDESEAEAEAEVEIERGRLLEPEPLKPELNLNERWTEITKDLVVRDAIERLGYEFEEYKAYYYIFSDLHPDQLDELIQLSDDIRKARRRRIQQINNEREARPARSPSLVDRRSPRPRWSGERRVKEREWIIDSRR